MNIWSNLFFIEKIVNTYYDRFLSKSKSKNKNGLIENLAII